MANESKNFSEFTNALTKVLNRLPNGKVFIINDLASKDNTYELSCQLSKKDVRFISVWAPNNKNVVDAYIKGYKEAILIGPQYIIEMDAGFSHDPDSIPTILELLKTNNCAFGSRFINGGSISNSSIKRQFLSKSGTILSNLLLGTKLKDMTSGYQGFRSEVVLNFLNYKLKSKSHFYQTELRYLLRNENQIEFPINYRFASKSVSAKSIFSSLSVLSYYFGKRIIGKPNIIKNL